MKVGMYVRTKYGIKKITEFICGQDVRFDNTNGFDEDLRKCHDVNGYKVDFVQDDWVVFNHNHPRQLNILAEDIKSIVTKEQFEQCVYEVE